MTEVIDLTKIGSENSFPHKDLTEKIIACALEVHSILGPGLLESIYEESLKHEFILQEIGFDNQKPVGLEYKGKPVGYHRLDFLVEDKVVVEVKATDSIHPIHEAQVLTYLRATEKKVGLIINFNVRQLRQGLKRLVL